MKTIQAVARYFPDSCGVIQSCLSEPIPVMRTDGVESKVVASHDRTQTGAYNDCGVEVYRYPLYQPSKSELNYGPFSRANLNSLPAG